MLFSLISTTRAFDHFNPQEYIAKLSKKGEVPIDPITRYERSLDCLLHWLPKEEIPGFVTSFDQNSLAIEYYQLTQYALAPRLMMNSIDLDKIIGYIPEEDDLDRILSKIQSETGRDVVILARCKPDIYLFERH
jgi:hypothetical protein